MKFFPHIMAFYILFLSLLPCADGQSKPVEERKVVKISVLTQQRSASHHIDDCSPICICSCCSIQTAVPDRFHSIMIQPFLSDKRNDCPVPAVKEMPRPIWQPPKIQC